MAAQMSYRQKPEGQTGRRSPNRWSRNQSYEQIIIQTLNSGSVQKPQVDQQQSEDEQRFNNTFKFHSDPDQSHAHEP